MTLKETLTESILASIKQAFDPNNTSGEWLVDADDGNGEFVVEFDPEQLLFKLVRGDENNAEAEVTTFKLTGITLQEV